MQSSIKNTQDMKRYENIRRVTHEESLATNTATFFTAASNTFFLMMRSHFRGSTFYLGNILIPFLVVFAITAFMPMTTGLSWVMFMSLTFAGFATYGTLFFTIKKSTIMKNISMTANESASLYFATFWAMFISLFITFAFVMALIMFFAVIGYSMENLSYMKNGTTWHVDFKQIWWDMLIYYVIMQTVLCFSISFFIEKIVSTQRNYFLVVMIYIIAGIFFSGMFSPTLYIADDGSIDAVSSSMSETVSGVSSLPPYKWGEPLWYVGQLFPHYGSNQLMWYSFLGGSWTENVEGILGPDGLPLERIWNPWNEINIFTSALSSKTLYYHLMPWVWTAVLLYIAGSIQRYGDH